MTAPFDGLSADELRALIRDVLREVLPTPNGSRQALSVTVNGKPATASTEPATPPSGVPAGRPGAAGTPGHVPAVSQPPAEPDPTVAAPPPAATQAARPPAGSGPPPRPVRLESDADLRQFALEVLRLADNPARRRDLLTGRLSFTLAGRARDAAKANDHRIETGAVTERTVQSAAKAGRRLVLGPRAVLTPLARDRALALGVPIEKER
jgi:hypothetical protein